MRSSPTEKRVLRPKGVWDPNRAGFKHPQPFSQGIVAPRGRLVFVAGQVALDAKGKVIGKGDARAQTQAVLENMKAVLAEAGARLEDVVKLTVFLTDVAHLPQVQEVRARYFPSDPPASSTIAISQLVNPDLLVEIEALAVLPEDELEAPGRKKGTTQQIRLSQETYEHLDALRRKGESFEQALKRMALPPRVLGRMSAKGALKSRPARKKRRA